MSKGRKKEKKRWSACSLLPAAAVANDAHKNVLSPHHHHHHHRTECMINHLRVICQSQSQANTHMSLLFIFSFCFFIPKSLFCLINSDGSGRGFFSRTLNGRGLNKGVGGGGGGVQEGGELSVTSKLCYCYCDTLTVQLNGSGCSLERKKSSVAESLQSRKIGTKCALGTCTAVVVRLWFAYFGCFLC